MSLFARGPVPPTRVPVLTPPPLEEVPWSAREERAVAWYRSEERRANRLIAEQADLYTQMDRLLLLLRSLVGWKSLEQGAIGLQPVVDTEGFVVRWECRFCGADGFPGRDGRLRARHAGRCTLLEVHDTLRQALGGITPASVAEGGAAPLSSADTSAEPLSGLPSGLPPTDALTQARTG